MLTLPPGFQAEIFADDFKRPRIAVEAPNGDVFVADPSIGTVLVLHDADGNHVIDASIRLQDGYDHSYFFMASFIADHLAFHAERLKT